MPTLLSASLDACMQGHKHSACSAHSLQRTAARPTLVTASVYTLVDWEPYSAPTLICRQAGRRGAARWAGIAKGPPEQLVHGTLPKRLD